MNMAQHHRSLGSSVIQLRLPGQTIFHLCGPSSASLHLLAAAASASAAELYKELTSAVAVTVSARGLCYCFTGAGQLRVGIATEA